MFLLAGITQVLLEQPYTVALYWDVGHERPAAFSMPCLCFWLVNISGRQKRSECRIRRDSSGMIEAIWCTKMNE